MIKLLWILTVSGVILCHSGCTSEPQDRTSLQRQSVDPAVGSMLIRSQDAFHAGQYSLALTLVDSAEGQAPDLADVPFLRGLIYSDLNRRAEAEAAYRRAADLDPAYKGVWLNLGNHAFRQGKHRSALEMYQQELRHHPSPEVHKMIGLAYDELNRPDSAHAAYQAAIASDSTFSVAHARLAQSFSRDGELEVALVHAGKALRLEPENMHYSYFVGHLLLRMGRSEEAVAYLTPVVKKLRWHRAAHHNLVQALERLGRGDEARSYAAWADTLQKVNEEIDLLVQQTTIYPDRAEQWVALGEHLRRIGRLEEALEAYDKAVYLAPERLDWLNNTAGLALALGKTARAIHAYRAILERDSGLSEVWVNLGIAYARLGSAAEARQAWEQALRQEPENPRAQTFLARYR